MKTTIHRSEWTDLLNEYNKTQCPPPPAGWKNMFELSDEWGLSLVQTRRVVRKLVLYGKLERKMFKRFYGGGVCMTLYVRKKK